MSITRSLLSRSPDAFGAGDKLHIIERQSQLGTGLPYRTNSPHHRLNMQAATMGISTDAPTEFADWMRKHQTDWRPYFTDVAVDDPFPPRGIYATYLQHNLNQAFRIANERGIEICVHRDVSVTDIKHADNSSVLLLDNSETIDCNYAVLALGHHSNNPLPHLAKTGGSLLSPYDLRTDGGVIAKNADVAILGSSLTAIDVALELQANGHQGGIQLVSRRGYLPAVQPEIESGLDKSQIRDLIAHELLGPSPLSLERVARKLNLHLRALTGQAHSHDALQMMRMQYRSTLENEIMAAEKGPIVHYEFLCATADIIERVWDRLSTEDKQRFDREYRSLWYAFRHAMPLPTARVLKAAFDTQSISLMVLDGDITHDPKRNRYSLQGHDPANQQPVNLDVDAVINATGDATNIQQIDDTLVQSLLESGLACPHPNGGFDVDFSTNKLLDSDGQTNNLFAIGALTRGVYFYTHAIDRVRAHASRIAGTIVNDLLASKRVY